MATEIRSPAAPAVRRRRRPERVLVAALPGQAVEPALQLAQALSASGRVTLAGLVPVDDRAALSRGAASARALRTHLRGEARRLGVSLAPRILVSYAPGADLAALAGEREADLLVLPWDAAPQAGIETLNDLLRTCPCSVAMLRGAPPQAPGELLAVLRGGADSEHALRLATNLAQRSGHRLRALRLSDDDGAEPDAPTRGLGQVLEHLPQVVEDALLLADEPAQAVLAEAAASDLVLIGAAATSDAGAPLDLLAQRLLAECPRPLIVARAAPGPQSAPADPPGLEAISILVDRWFAENTFHADEFADLARLLERKRQQGLTVSLALPALNEQATIERVIQTVRGALMEGVPLLDEIVLIDSDSTDRTREIAAGLGVPVHVHQQVLPAYGARAGKGEALWKSLYLTRGDLVLWIDTDIVNIHPRFVYGLLGPLLLRPDLVFVKGFYLRPMKVGDSVQAGGGGRVTELTARPLLNLFYPALSGLIQPLSGEYGGRRRALEQVPFSSGYGVETGLLIDLYERFGIGAIGQVDLIERIHHNQPLTALSLMSFAIIQTVIRKLDRSHGLTLLDDVNRSMKLIRRRAGRFWLEVGQVAERERPPMASLPEYRARFPEAAPPEGA